MKVVIEYPNLRHFYFYYSLKDRLSVSNWFWATNYRAVTNIALMHAWKFEKQWAGQTAPTRETLAVTHSAEEVLFSKQMGINDILDGIEEVSLI